MRKSNKNILSISILSGFVILISGRDVAYELFLKKNPDGVSFAFWICATVSVLSGIWLFFHGEINILIRSLSKRNVLSASIVLGIMCAVIYVSTFAVIEIVGAGLFNMIDWGLAPVLTAIIGLWLDKDNVSRVRIFISFICYLAGIVGLWSAEPQLWGPLVFIALLSPIFTATSFPLQRWLMTENGGNLTRAQVTFIRFLPATMVIFCYHWIINGSLPAIVTPVKLFSVTIILGFVPMILLCYALIKSTLSRFAIWQFAIPALTFFCTLYVHPNHQSYIPIISGIVILAAILFMEWPGRKT